MLPNYTGRVGSHIINSADQEAWSAGLSQALIELDAGRSIVIPTDTVYGIACNPFSPEAVAGLLAHKGRSRQMPPPVLVGSKEDAFRLAGQIPPGVSAVMSEFWPGAVTVILNAAPDLVWDIGETRGTVAIRMPNHPVAVELLVASGPLAVSSANRTGQKPPLTVDGAYQQFGESLGLYIDAGEVGGYYREASGDPGSTIVDASGVHCGRPWSVVRHGVVPWESIRAVAGGEWER